MLEIPLDQYTQFLRYCLPAAQLSIRCEHCEEQRTVLPAISLPAVSGGIVIHRRYQPISAHWRRRCTMRFKLCGLICIYYEEQDVFNDPALGWLRQGTYTVFPARK